MQTRVQDSRTTIAAQPDWAAVRERLDKERQLTLPGTDTTKAVQQFRLAWEAAKSAGPAADSSGLIEQQARFSLLRESLEAIQDG